MMLVFSLVWQALLYAGLVSASPQVKLRNTMVTGTPFEDAQQDFFGGIPFAVPPVGSLRFVPPVIKLDPEVMELDATRFRPACPQGLGYGYTPEQISSLSISEDCLTLNILRPAGLNSSGDDLLPVMFWVYGGGFQNGVAMLYNGTGIVRRSVERGSPIIFVNVNYRVGPFGYPQGAEAAARGALNLGNKDVLAALTWIQSNIAAFGGDKDKVTVFGVSAGSILLSQLLLDPEFRLARAAILESGSPATAMLFNATSRELAWRTLVSAVPECTGASNDSTFNCLRLASAETIVNATNYVYLHVPSEFPFVPVIDGPGGLIPGSPSNLYLAGRFSRVPFIAGTNLDEGTVFIPTSINSTEMLRTWIVSNATSPVATTTKQSPIADRILELYPDNPALGSPYGTGNETFGLSSVYKQASSILGDTAFTSLRRQLSQAASNYGIKTYAYLFTDPQTGTDSAYLGVPHGAEAPYVFGAPENGPASVALSQNMIDYWVSFAVSLNPNDGFGNALRPEWTEYTNSSKDALQLDSRNLTMISDTFREEQIAYLIENAVALSH